MKNIALIGFMGAGKSTVAEALQKRYGMEIVEMDALIIKREKMPIPEIFAQRRGSLFPGEGDGSFGGTPGKRKCGDFLRRAAFPCGKKMWRLCAETAMWYGCVQSLRRSWSGCGILMTDHCWREEETWNISRN